MTPSVLLTTALLTLNAGKALVARPAPAGLVLDGDLTEWNPGHFSTSPPTEIVAGTSFIEEGAIGSNADHSARVYVSYDAKSVIIGALITDDHLVSQYRHGDMWQGDLFEIIVPRSGRAGVLHVGVNPVGDAHLFSPAQKATADAEKAIRASARIEKDGWVVEVSIPFRAFGALGAEATWPINFAFKDADPGEPSIAHRVWSGLRHQQRASAGTVVLDRTASAPPVAPTCPPFTKTIELSAPLTVKGPALLAKTEPVTLRIVNFQSATENWSTFWSSFRPDEIRSALDIAKRLKANAIRIFVFDEVFGIDAVKPEMLEHLHLVVREAAARGLLSIVTFFPFKKEFRPEWYARMQGHLEAIVASFVNDPAIAMWDLMNEPDHMWALYDGGVTPSDVSRWATRMSSAVKAADPSHLVTVGLAGHFLNKPIFAADEALPFVDVVSFHFYGELKELPGLLERARAGLPKPLVLQEFGVTSLYESDEEAAATLDAICQRAAAASLTGVGFWELFDHPVGSIAHLPQRWSETVENDFGLLTFDKRFKRQAASFCQCMKVPGFRLVAPKSQ